MNHVRIATFDITHGTVDEIVEAVSSEGGLRDVFRSLPGFQSNSLIEIDPITCISISVWETHEAAEHAVVESAIWVAEHVESRTHRTANWVGEARYWDLAGLEPTSD
ncbi:MAG: hypothetical protein WCK41_01575 [Actinomycetes bacterium]